MRQHCREMAFFHHVLIVSLAWISVLTAEEQFIFQTSDWRDTVVVLTLNGNGSEENCDILTDKDLIDEALNSTDADNILTVSDEDMEEILQECEEFMANGDTNDTVMMGETGMDAPKTTTAGYDGWNVIFPGTKWCGAGDIAENYDDLGLHQDTDRCCRAHDLCNDTMAPGEKRNTLTNTSPFTALSCKCDLDFYSCLDRVDTTTSNTIGNLYFNILKRQCYQFGYKKICKRRIPIIKKCLKYVKDTKQTYHWMDAKVYKKLPVPGPLTVTLPF